MPDSNQRIVVIVGQTASGKSDLAVHVAQALDGEIISADSMQVYKHLDAGTAKPSQDQRDRAPHHLIDCVDPTDPFTVADWLEATAALIVQIRQRGRLPIVVGGTNLYIKGLLEGMFEGPGTDTAFRQSLDDLTPQELHRKLVAVDQASADRIHPNDRKRLVRALEVFHVTGKPISTFQQQWADSAAKTVGARAQYPAPDRYRYHPVMLGPDWSISAINRRINARVKQMFQPPEGIEGLLEETRRLLDGGLLGEQAREAIGTKQVLDYFNGKHETEKDVMERVKIDTRRFAKAQRTWLKRYRGVNWFPAEEMGAQRLIEQAVNHVRTELSSADEQA